jgi:O-antigen/teichoic acid export membrane protein
VFATRYKTSPRLVLLATFGGASTLNYAFGLAMGWLLAPGDYGLLAFAQAWLLVGGMVLNWGFTWSLARAVAKANDLHERDALVRGSLLANFAVATAIGAVLVALFAAGPLRGGFEGWPVAVVVALCLPFISLVATATGCAQGSERFGITAWLVLTEVSCKMLSGVALVLLGFGADGAIAGFLVGAVCAAALGFRKLTHSIGVRLRGSLSVPDVGMSVAMFGALLGLSMLLNLDLVGLKLLSHERTLVGYYQAGVVLSNAPYYLVVSTILPVFFVQLARHENVSATQKKLGETLGLAAALILPLEIVLMAFPEQALTTVFPDVYAAGAPALRILAIGNTLLILAAIFSAAFQAVGRAKVPALILLVVVLVEPFALWAAVPSGQTLGAAWVFVAAAFLTLFCLVAVYLRETRVVYLRQVAPWVVRYVLAVGVGLVAGLLMLGLGAGTAVAMGGVCYLAVAVLLQIVRPPAMLSGSGAFLRKLVFYKEE